MAKDKPIGKSGMQAQLVLIVTEILLIAGYALGFTVNSSFWSTDNVIASGRVPFISAGAAAIVAGVLYIILSKTTLNDIVLHIISLGMGMLAMFALTSMWSNCVVEIAYIYGEGNLEIGNANAVRGSVFLFVSTGCYVLAAIGSIAVNALKRVSQTEK